MKNIAPYPKWRAYADDGELLAGGLLYTYEAGTATSKASYSDEALATENTNPVVLNARGECDLFLKGYYKMILKDADGNLIWSEDYVCAPGFWWWEEEPAAIAFVDATSFTVAGDLTIRYIADRAVKFDQTSDAAGWITSSSYNAGSGLTTVIMNSVTLDSGLSTVFYGPDILAIATDLNGLGGAISGAASKATPADADTIGISDSAASGILKKLTFANLRTWLMSFFKVKHGVENRTDSTLAFTDGTRTFEIAPTGATFNIALDGVKYAEDGATVVIPDTIGTHFIYYTANDTLVSSLTPWEPNSVTKVLIATIYWSGTAGKIGDERHFWNRGLSWHKWSHDTVGTRYESGLAGTFDDTTFSIATGEVHDEDLEIDVTGPETTGGLWYRSVGGATMIFETGVTTPYKATAGALQYDNGGTLTAVGTNKFVANYVIIGNDPDEPVEIIVGQAQHNNIGQARNDDFPTLPNISFTEGKLIYRVIYKNTGGSPEFIEQSDRRADILGPINSTTPTDHANMASLEFSVSNHTGFDRESARNPHGTITGASPATLNATDFTEHTGDFDEDWTATIEGLTVPSASILFRFDVSGGAEPTITLTGATEFVFPVNQTLDLTDLADGTYRVVFDSTDDNVTVTVSVQQES